MYKMKFFTEKELKIVNAPYNVINNMMLLVQKILDPLREKVGRIKINSGYRSVAYNEAVGGVPTSQHCKGEAVDLVTLDCPLREAFLFIINNFQFDQIIFEKSNNGSEWIHISYKKEKNRNQILIANKINNKWVYIPYKKGVKF